MNCKEHQGEHKCGNCKYNKWAKGYWYCGNKDSDLYTCETDYNDSCIDYEEKE